MSENARPNYGAHGAQGEGRLMPTPWQVLVGRSTPSELLVDLVRANRRGERVGIYSVCSANRFVLEAVALQARRDGTPLLIESTSNQVNQFGGYTGMTPADFRAFVGVVAAQMGVPASRVLCGGDHIGPHVWRSEPAVSAMAKARELVRDYVQAGYTKIHLDTSMRLADDAVDGPLDELVIIDRTADLCAAAEAAHAPLAALAPPPVYVVGSEVPIPGGELAGQTEPTVTQAADVHRTLTLMHTAFLERGLADAWERVIAVVVQPGVEFGDASVFEYDRSRALLLSRLAEQEDSLAYEAHSTDYQTPNALRELVEDHFAVLKVGPALTFAMREALFALGRIEQELPGCRSGTRRSGLRRALQRVMIEDPQHWTSYYRGDDDQLNFARDFSLSDRSRYYWPRPEIQAALGQLLGRLSAHPIPLALLSQYLPVEYAAVREGSLANEPVELIRHRILGVVDAYADACGMR